MLIVGGVAAGCSRTVPDLLQMPLDDFGRLWGVTSNNPGHPSPPKGDSAALVADQPESPTGRDGSTPAPATAKP